MGCPKRPNEKERGAHGVAGVREHAPDHAVAALLHGHAQRLPLDAQELALHLEGPAWPCLG